MPVNAKKSLGAGRAALRWWMAHDPATGPASSRLPTDADVPALAVGDRVRLIARPQRVRRVLRVEWHAMRHTWVYAVETSSERWCPAYWFREQLERVESWKRVGLLLPRKRPVVLG
jgi:hypothetical protein